MKQPILLYLVTEDYYFVSHRLPMACAAQRAGYEVHVATRVDRHRSLIEGLGFHLHPLHWRRGSFNPLDVAAMVFEVRRLYRRIGPNIVHHVAIEPTVVGSLALIGAPVVSLNGLMGLGFAFSSESAKARVLRNVLGLLFRFLLSGRNATVLVQSRDDYTTLTSFGIGPDRVIVIRGSGVDTNVLLPLPEPNTPITLAFAGRLLRYKGVRTLVAAQKFLVDSGRPVRLLVAGQPDPANPDSIPADEVEQWSRQDGVTMLGQVDDIRDVWARAHIAVLVSRREGVPKSLLEAAACGRPIVASDVPGCREIARAGANALVVPPDDPQALATAIDRLTRDPDLRRKLGEAGRKLVEAEFSSEHIGRQTVSLYDRLLGGRDAFQVDAVAAPPLVPAGPVDQLRLGMFEAGVGKPEVVEPVIERSRPRS